MINKFIYFYKYGSPGVPGSLMKNIIYKSLWRLNLINSPSAGRYKEYTAYKRKWIEVGDIS